MPMRMRVVIPVWARTRSAWLAAKPIFVRKAYKDGNVKEKCGDERREITRSLSECTELVGTVLPRSSMRHYVNCLGA